MTCQFNAENNVPCTCEMPLRKFSVWSVLSNGTRFFDYDRNVKRLGLTRNTIEASDPVAAAENWVARDADNRCAYSDQTIIVCDENGKTVAIVDVECETVHKFKGKARK